MKVMQTYVRFAIHDNKIEKAVAQGCG